MEESGKVRLVRCPKCQNLLPELADYSVYQCGGCGAVLRAKHKGYGSGGSLSETSDERESGGDHARSGNSLGKGIVDMSVNSYVHVKSNGGSLRYDIKRVQRKQKKEHEMFLNRSEYSDEKGVLENQGIGIAER